jgi:hypothetical protein
MIIKQVEQLQQQMKQQASHDVELQGQIKELQLCLEQLLDRLIDADLSSPQGIVWLKAGCHKLLVQVNQLGKVKN